MPNGSATIVQKVWNYCNVLRDAGLSYGDYIEQLTYLLFLKMADERKQLQPDRAPHITEGYEWSDLVKLEGGALEIQYRKTLETLGRERGMLGTIFRKAQNKILNPALLHRLVADLIDREEWTILDVDVKGDAY
jgi:type I restriction enzyme M protein